MLKGRSGEPVVLIVGDEAVPVTVGLTVAVGKDSCCWVFKKEHLGLEEVGAVIGKINSAKKEADRRGGRRTHEFFLPRGSKVLVCSYVHLRMVGVGAYVEDFGKMVRDVWRVTGDVEVEVLPVVPVVMEGIDAKGRELLAGLKDWIGWLSGRMMRESIRHLSLTGGVEHEEGEVVNIIYVPSMVVQKEKGQMEGGWRTGAVRGKELIELRAGVREVRVKRMSQSRMLGKMQEAGGARMDTGEQEEERRSRESDEHGVSMEGEYAFSKAVGDFCREGVREGTYKGNYVLNIKEQMEDRVRRREGEAKKLRVLFIGGSQIGRIMDEVTKVGKQVVSECQWVKVSGELTDEVKWDVIGELREKGSTWDKVVYGGPSNSLVKHGVGEKRGHHPERMVTVEKDSTGKVVRMGVKYHMTEPVRVTMTERRDLVDRMMELMDIVTEEKAAEEGIYITMFPRHVERCCGREGHMGEGDSLVVASVRRDLDRDIREELKDKGGRVKVVEWWRLLKMEKEGTLKEIIEKRVVSNDGVHLSPNMNRLAAVSLCHRLLEGPEEDDIWSETSSVSKKQKMG
jgi:hypothetical protein